MPHKLFARFFSGGKFGDNNKWAFSPSGAFCQQGVSLVVVRICVKRRETSDELKLHLSYGVNGSQGISPCTFISFKGYDPEAGLWQ